MIKITVGGSTTRTVLLSELIGRVIKHQTEHYLVVIDNEDDIHLVDLGDGVLIPNEDFRTWDGLASVYDEDVSLTVSVSREVCSLK